MNGNKEFREVGERQLSLVEAGTIAPLRWMRRLANPSEQVTDVGRRGG